MELASAHNMKSAQICGGVEGSVTGRVFSHTQWIALLHCNVIVGLQPPQAARGI
jgi:hypothetical protein